MSSYESIDVEHILSLKQLNQLNIQWTCIEETYMMELVSGFRQLKNSSYLSYIHLFEFNVTNFQIIQAGFYLFYYFLRYGLF